MGKWSRGRSLRGRLPSLIPSGERPKTRVKRIDQTRAYHEAMAAVLEEAGGTVNARAHLSKLVSPEKVHQWARSRLRDIEGELRELEAKRDAIRELFECPACHGKGWDDLGLTPCEKCQGRGLYWPDLEEKS